MGVGTGSLGGEYCVAASTVCLGCVNIDLVSKRPCGLCGIFGEREGCRGVVVGEDRFVIGRGDLEADKV